MTATEVDYTSLNGPQLHAACGIDGSKWAEAFCQHEKKHSGRDLDGGLALAWFCNAMMAMHDHCRPDQAPVILPDGSACFVS